MADGTSNGNGAHVPASAVRQCSKQQSAVAAGSTHLAPWQEALLRHRGALWAGSALLTALGRVLANAHWVSDTLAGACLGCGMVSGTVLVWNWLSEGDKVERP
jgi:hypothetical protein